MKNNKITTIVNFRDLGGITGADGRKVRHRRLLRTAELQKASSADLNSLVKNYDLKCIVDLRSAEEIKFAPDPQPKGVDYVNLDITRAIEERAPSLFTFESLNSERKVLRYMKKLYTDIIRCSHAQACYADFIKLLLQRNEGATLFHCFAGKDRTGLAAAIILEILGVSKESIFEDYLKTNIQRARQNQEMMNEEKKKGKSVKEIKVLYLAMSVHSDYLQKAYAVAEKKYGSFLNYIQSTMNVSDDDVLALRKNYLETVKK